MKVHTQQLHNLTRLLSAWTMAALVVCVLWLSPGLTATAQMDDEGLISTKPSLMWLSEDFNIAPDEGTSYDSLLSKGELWSDNWGVSASVLGNNDRNVFGVPQDSEILNLDVKRRFGAKDKSNFELGLGWQSFSVDERLDIRGPRLSLSGRYNVTEGIQLYGETAYFPYLDEQVSNIETSGFEVEAGLMYQPLPKLSLKAGYRRLSIDLNDPMIQDVGSTSGFLLGTDLSF